MTAQRGDFDRPPAPGPRFRDQLAEDVHQALYDLMVDHPMWIDGRGRGLDYSPEREIRIGDFLDAATAAVVARVQAAANQRAAEIGDAYVWIDPARRSGEPCIGGHRLSVELVIESVWYGDVHTAMATYCITRWQVLAACWYAGAGYPVRLHAKDGSYRPHRGPWAKRWGAWAAEVHQALWETSTVDYDAIPDPPAAALARPAPPED